MGDPVHRQAPSPGPEARAAGDVVSVPRVGVACLAAGVGRFGAGSWWEDDMGEADGGSRRDAGAGFGHRPGARYVETCKAGDRIPLGELELVVLEDTVAPAGPGRRQRSGDLGTEPLARGVMPLGFQYVCVGDAWLDEDGEHRSGPRLLRCKQRTEIRHESCPTVSLPAGWYLVQPS